MTPSGSIPSGPPWSLSLELSDMFKKKKRRLEHPTKVQRTKKSGGPLKETKLKRPRLVSREIPPNDEGLPAVAFCA